MVLGNEISLICGRNFIVVESFSGQLSGADGCNGILLLETAVGVVGIITIVFGILLLILAPRIKKLMLDVK